MKTTIKCILLLASLSIFSACSKSDFLNKKPITSIVTPSTLTDFQYLLDNTVYQGTGALSQLADDDYVVINDEGLNALSATERNSYVWAKDTYGGGSDIADWNIPYKNIFYSNSVLDGLAKSDSASSTRGQYLKGWALFNRSYFLYDLIRNFCKVYDAETASTDLGIPLRLSSGIDKVEKRASLNTCMERVIADLKIAENLLPSKRPSANLNRPSKIAVYALLSRIYLDRRDYATAGDYADKCLALYSTLIDYNLLDRTSNAPFYQVPDELIYNTATITGYDMVLALYGPNRISNDLIDLYDSKDLRLAIYYNAEEDGTYTKKRGYYGDGYYPFTGLATDEVYLIKAECLARKGEAIAAMEKLNQLLIKRFANSTAYVPLTASSPADAVAKILLERRKELVYRGLRWHDLKRFNKADNITLTRTANGLTYTLPPNDPRWVFPIPNDEIILSNIPQNPR